MLIGCCADTHGRVPPIFEDANLVLHAGDVYNFDRMNEPAVYELTRALPTLLVRGNHDITDAEGIFKGHDLSGQVIDGTPWLRKKVWLVGIGMHAGDTAFCPGEAAVAEQCRSVLQQAIDKMGEGDPSIIVSHYPAKLPSRTVSKKASQVYYQCVWTLAEALRPLIVIQGHVHRDAGRGFEHNGIKYFFPGPSGARIHIDDETLELTIKRCQGTGDC